MAEEFDPKSMLYYKLARNGTRGSRHAYENYIQVVDELFKYQVVASWWTFGNRKTTKVIFRTSQVMKASHFLRKNIEKKLKLGNGYRKVSMKNSLNEHIQAKSSKPAVIANVDITPAPSIEVFHSDNPWVNSDMTQWM